MAGAAPRCSELPAKPVDKVPRARIQPGAVVNNEPLGRVLEYAREQQIESEDDRAQFSRTKRDWRLAQKRLVAVGSE